MLTESKIALLVGVLKDAHDLVLVSSRLLEHAKDREQVAVADVLLAYEYEGKNAEARAREAVIALDRSESVHSATQARMDAEQNHTEAKYILEQARASISLYKALAYQGGGVRDEKEQ